MPNTELILAFAQEAARNGNETIPAVPNLSRPQYARPSQGAKKRGGKEAPELLKLLNARASWNLAPFRQPRFSGQQLHQIDVAAALHAQAFASDPFAANRVRMLMLRGIETEQAIRDEANRILSSRSGSMGNFS